MIQFIISVIIISSLNGVPVQIRTGVDEQPVFGHIYAGQYDVIETTQDRNGETRVLLRLSTDVQGWILWNPASSEMQMGRKLFVYAIGEQDRSGNEMRIGGKSKVLND